MQGWWSTSWTGQRSQTKLGRRPSGLWWSHLSNPPSPDKFLRRSSWPAWRNTTDKDHIMWRPRWRWHLRETIKLACECVTIVELWKGKMEDIVLPSQAELHYTRMLFSSSIISSCLVCKHSNLSQDKEVQPHKSLSNTEHSPSFTLKRDIRLLTFIALYREEWKKILLCDLQLNPL